MNTKISILGCGWLGFPLAKSLFDTNHIVKGSVHDNSDLDKLKSESISPYLISVAPNNTYPKAFFDSDILIITLPFKRDLEDPTYYVNQCQSLIPIIEKSPIAWVIFTSSTTVYPALNQTAKESDVIEPNSDRARVLLDCEQLFLTNPHFEGTVIRFGGLYGPGREPGRFLKGNTSIPNGNAPVNLIHLDDCIGIIEAIIDQNQRGEIFNGVHPDHPTKSEFYGLPSEPGSDRPSKQVSSQKVIDKLGYRFKPLSGT